MSETIEVLIEAEDDLQSCLVTFDGSVVEFFGYRQIQSTRVHVRQITEVEVTYKSGLLSTPMINLKARFGSLGYTQPIAPKNEAVKPEIEKLAEAIREAVSRNPEASF